MLPAWYAARDKQCKICCCGLCCHELRQGVGLGVSQGDVVGETVDCWVAQLLWLFSYVCKG